VDLAAELVVADLHPIFVKIRWTAQDFHDVCLNMERDEMIERIRAELRAAKVVAMLGPRQVGKTTLAREFTAVSGLGFDAGFIKSM